MEVLNAMKAISKTEFPNVSSVENHLMLLIITWGWGVARWFGKWWLGH